MNILVSLLVAALLAVGSSRALAQESGPPLGVDALLKKSALVIRGPVLEVDLTAFNTAENKPYTRVLIGVDEVLDGEWLESTIEFTLPGGLFPDGRFSEWVGIPSFEVGETVVMYVKAGDWHVSPVAGLSQGLLREVEVEGQRYLSDLEGHVLTGFSKTQTPIYGRQIADRAQDLLQKRALVALGADPKEVDAERARAGAVAPGSPAGAPAAVEMLKELRALIKEERARAQAARGGKPAAVPLRHAPAGPIVMHKE